jgi:hypothetical protein
MKSPDTGLAIIIPAFPDQGDIFSTPTDARKAMFGFPEEFGSICKRGIEF